LKKGVAGKGGFLEGEENTITREREVAGGIGVETDWSRQKKGGRKAEKYSRQKGKKDGLREEEEKPPC